MMRSKWIKAAWLLACVVVFSSCNKDAGCPAYKHRVIPVEKGSPFSFSKKKGKKKSSRKPRDKGLFGNSGIKR
ncbi:MAG: hypothetical protein H6585_15715 [Flavobacteriales bacterium]|nr:hypothetical protein [Flavobacteriales bacterium]MCB9449779.1 hypothetical protein [Flavobacteriales bacterium]